MGISMGGFLNKNNKQKNPSHIFTKSVAGETNAANVTRARGGRSFMKCGR